MASPVPPTPIPLAETPPTFEQIVADCYDDVYRFALSLAGQQCDAVDLTQNAFLKFAKKGSSIRETKKAKSWLFSVLRNEFIDLKRKSTRFPTQELDPDLHSETPSAASHSDGQAVLKILANLPQPFRETLALYYLQGHTYPEIATILKIPIGTVMPRLSRGNAQLREKLKAPHHVTATSHG
jgi:RNA polymerase sigma-70 factor (ECF subfamily)